MNKITITKKQEIAVRYLKVSARVRYWEDAEVNEKEDEEGNLIPFRNGEDWEPCIDLKTGTILEWPIGTTASVHYKVCDAGIYTLLDENKREVTTKEGYVPNCLAPDDDGYGDYIIMKVDESGRIANWKADLRDFIEGD